MILRYLQNRLLGNYPTQIQRELQVIFLKLIKNYTLRAQKYSIKTKFSTTTYEYIIIRIFLVLYFFSLFFTQILACQSNKV